MKSTLSLFLLLIAALALTQELGKSDVTEFIAGKTKIFPASSKGFRMSIKLPRSWKKVDSSAEVLCNFTRSYGGRRVYMSISMTALDKAPSAAEVKRVTAADYLKKVFEEESTSISAETKRMWGQPVGYLEHSDPGDDGYMMRFHTYMFYRGRYEVQVDFVVSGDDDNKVLASAREMRPLFAKMMQSIKFG